MKYFILLSAFVAMAYSNRFNREEIADICGGGRPDRDCRKNVKTCMGIMRDSLVGLKNETAVEVCLQEQGINDTSSIPDAIKKFIASKRPGGKPGRRNRQNPADILENELVQGFKDCMLNATGALDENGDIDFGVIRDQILSRLQTSLADNPEFYEAMAAEMEKCPEPVEFTGFKDTKEVRLCMAKACVGKLNLYNSAEA